VHVVNGRKVEEMSAAELRAAALPYARVVVDVGAGDGRFAYNLAKAQPAAFVVGMEPVAENLRESSSRARRKPERGGLPNVIYVTASIETPPPELVGVADEVSVVLPWGSLMRGIILGGDGVLRGLAGLAKADGTVRIVVNTLIFDDPVPLEARDLPEPSPEYVTSVLAPKYAAHGLRIDEARFFDADEVAALPSTWAKRLSHRRPPPSVLIVATKETGGGGDA
jgi:16S rRNA (adenine(1408)-N(1))-methyltransferase